MKLQASGTVNDSSQKCLMLGLEAVGKIHLQKMSSRQKLQRAEVSEEA